MSFRREVRNLLRNLFPADAQVRHGGLDEPAQKGKQVFIMPSSNMLSVHDHLYEPDANGIAKRVHNGLAEVSIHIFADDADECEAMTFDAQAHRSSEAFKDKCRAAGMFIVAMNPVGLVPIADMRTGGVTYRPRSIITLTIEWRHSFDDDVGLIEGVEIVGQVQDDGSTNSATLTSTLNKGDIHGE